MTDVIANIKDENFFETKAETIILHINNKLDINFDHYVIRQMINAIPFFKDRIMCKITRKKDPPIGYFIYLGVFPIKGNFKKIILLVSFSLDTKIGWKESIGPVLKSVKKIISSRFFKGTIAISPIGIGTPNFEYIAVNKLATELKGINNVLVYERAQL